MLTQKSKEYSSTSEVTKSGNKSNSQTDAPSVQTKLNPVWHRLATHSDTSTIQRMCAECEQEPPESLVKTGIQTKLSVGAVDDPYEKEADRVADLVQRSPTSAGTLPSDEAEEQEISTSTVPGVQTKVNSDSLTTATKHDTVTHAVNSPGTGSPLNHSVRERVEPVLGTDLSGVRVHSNSQAQAAAKGLNAKAFTHQNNIFLGKGQSASDVSLMAHESTHVAQQARAPTAAPVLRRLVNPTTVARKNKTQLIGDGTAANQGIRIRDLRPYVAAQADWFSEPTLTAADRTLVWNMLHRLDNDSAFATATRNLRMTEVASLSIADMALINSYAQGFNPTAQTIRLSSSVNTVNEAKTKGQTMNTLSTFIPAPVMRVVIPESGLEYLINNSKTAELQKYFADFSPTMETPDEWTHVETLLNTTLAPYAALKGWVSDLHIMDAATLNTLVTNVGDFSRGRPVLLILFSATDHNAAFMQASDIRAAVANATNLALVLQGFPSLASMAARSATIARDYGQQEILGVDITSFSLRRGPGRLGQVMIAGHGEHSSVDMGINTAAHPPANIDDQYVSYGGEAIDSATNIANTQHLIDTLINNLDPTDAHIVFAGCLVGSHEFPASMALGNPATAATTLRTHLAGSKNLRDFVNDRMAALGVTGNVQAAQASATEDAFLMDPSGRVFISDPDDLNIGGTPDQYVQTGSEPEGALRAALETYADTRYGPAQTTTWMRARVTALAGDRGWYRTQTRSAYDLALPAAGNVSAAKILDLSHRVGSWLNAGWAGEIDVGDLELDVHAGEETTVYPAMLASNKGSKDHLQVGVQEAWMHKDATHVPSFENELTNSALKRRTFRPLLERHIVNPHLATLFTISGAPTRGQMLLALTIAVDDGTAMPADANSFLRAAAGGVATNNFPATTNASTLLDGVGEESVLQDIGLAVGTAPASGSSGPTPVDANIDLDADSTNERFIAIARRDASVTASVLRVRSQPSLSGRIIDYVHNGDIVRVMGTRGSWSLIDHNGNVGFVGSRYIV